MLSYASQWKGLPTPLKLSQLLLALTVGAIPLMWVMASNALAYYFLRTTSNFHPFLQSARSASLALDTAPQLVLMTSATIGMTLAGCAWRAHPRARVVLALHALVFAIGLSTLISPR